MTPTYLNSSPTYVPTEQLNLAQQDQGGLQQQGDKYFSRNESSDRILSSTHATEQSDGNYSIEMSNCKQENEGRKGNILSVKWMSSKMRLMKKMMNKDRTVLDRQMQTTSSTFDTDNSSNNSSPDNNNIIRTCSDCNTTKTPLWRSGPRGPKSLCNACGIRQRKARRAIAAAAQAEASDTLVASETSSTSGTKLCVKAKRCKPTPYCSRKKLCFEDLVLSLSKNSAFHKDFPQDEKEAAILLMALSCGLAYG